MQKIKHIYVSETDSTNRYLKEYKGEMGSLITVVQTDYQTDGRGQGRNTWESDRGKNLLVSILIHPFNVPASRQFVLLQAAALAIKKTLEQYAQGFSIKWPNDIYYNDSKISGTLSECNISSKGIKQCIIGTGININQQVFTSDAPNPISLCNISGCEQNIKEVLDHLLTFTEHYISIVEEGRFNDIDKEYKEALYRREGMHPYTDDGGMFMAEIEDITHNGHLLLKKENGRLSEYAFKEVTFVIQPQNS